jgi:hypothetical protein
MEKIKIFAEKYSLYFILLLAAALRVFRIGDRDLWYDEAFTGVALKEKFWSMIDMIIKDVHPPLYYVTAKIFASFFNYSVAGIRLYSALLGVLGIWAIYLLAKDLFGKKSALWASLIMAVSPFAIQYSQEARMYALFGLFFVLASHFLFRGLETGKTKYYLLWGLFLGLSALTHYMGIITFPIFILVFWGWKIFHGDKAKTKINFLKFKFFLPSKKLMMGYGIFALVFSFWIPIFYMHLFKTGSLVWIKPATLSDIFVNVQIFIFGSPLGEMTGGLSGIPRPSEMSGISSGSVMLGLVIFFSAIITYLFKKEEKKEKIISILILSFGYLFVIYLLSLLGGHYLISRYLLSAAYLLYILIGVWISKIKFRYAAFFIALYLLLLNLTIPVQNSTGWNKLGEDKTKFQGKDFYVLNPFDYVIAKYYLGSNHLILYNMDTPSYTAGNWAAIGNSARSTGNFDDIRNNPNGLLLSNVILRDQIDGVNGARSKSNLELTNLKILKRYDNIIIYAFH